MLLFSAMCQIVNGDHAAALAHLRAWASTVGFVTVKQKVQRKLSLVFFQLLDGTSLLEVQLVDPAGFDTPVDFNVNNLKVVQDVAHNIIRLELKKKDQTNAGSVTTVCRDIVSG